MGQGAKEPSPVTTEASGRVTLTVTVAPGAKPAYEAMPFAPYVAELKDRGIVVDVEESPPR